MSASLYVQGISFEQIESVLQAIYKKQCKGRTQYVNWGFVCAICSCSGFKKTPGTVNRN